MATMETITHPMMAIDHAGCVKSKLKLPEILAGLGDYLYLCIA